MVAGFAVYETITVVTQNGNCEIQLCFGDITKLQQEDKVDVIMISAFRGDYAETPTSVIGALKRNLKLSVRELARNKAEDLRNLYSCWWSHPLPTNLPYKRLLCFETLGFRGSSEPQELVGDVYRCLIPVLNNQDGTVITPLLNTGDQGYNKVLMLKGMVEAAVNWMKAGLPLRKLKVVLYSRFEAGDPPPMSGFSNVCEMFGKLKEKFDMKSVIPKEVKIEYDVYLSFSKEDGETANSISKHLEVTKPDIRIFGKQQELNTDEAWQEDMYEVMIRCARVITVLSPNYLKSIPCVEQYNIALCCNRKARRDILAPFYIEQVEKMPTYMTLVQYIDCLSVKISYACEQLALTLNVEVHAEFVHEQPTLEYDVFISYCHRNTQQAALLRETINKLDPNLKLFFDIQELKTGTTWQQTLYHAIDGTQVLVAMITKEYLLSPVCREEFNLALTKHCKQTRELTLIPVLLDDDIQDVPLGFKQIKLVNASGESFKSAINSTAEAIVAYLNNKVTSENMKELFTESIVMEIDAVQENLRTSELMAEYPKSTRKAQAYFPPDLNKFFLKNKDVVKSAKEKQSCDIVFSFSANDKKYASFFCKLLNYLASPLTVVNETKSAQDKRDALDIATKIVTFSSPSYTESEDCIEDFNIALCRHRTQKSPVIFPIQVHNLPQRPTYFHAVQYPVAITDAIWSSLIMRNHVFIDDNIKKLNEGLSEPEILALVIAACKLIKQFKQFKSKSASTPPPRPVLSNIGRLKADTNYLKNEEDTENRMSEMFIHVEMPDCQSKARDDARNENNEKKQKEEESNEENIENKKDSGTATTKQEPSMAVVTDITSENILDDSKVEPLKEPKDTKEQEKNQLNRDVKEVLTNDEKNIIEEPVIDEKEHESDKIKENHPKDLATENGLSKSKMCLLF